MASDGINYSEIEVRETKDTIVELQEHEVEDSLLSAPQSRSEEGRLLPTTSANNVNLKGLRNITQTQLAQISAPRKQNISGHKRGFQERNKSRNVPAKRPKPASAYASQVDGFNVIGVVKPEFKQHIAAATREMFEKWGKDGNTNLWQRYENETKDIYYPNVEGNDWFVSEIVEKANEKIIGEGERQEQLLKNENVVAYLKKLLESTERMNKGGWAERYKFKIPDHRQQDHSSGPSQIQTQISFYTAPMEAGTTGSQAPSKPGKQKMESTDIRTEQGKTPSIATKDVLPTKLTILDVRRACAVCSGNLTAKSKKVLLLFKNGDILEQQKTGKI